MNPYKHDDQDLLSEVTSRRQRPKGKAEESAASDSDFQLDLGQVLSKSGAARLKWLAKGLSLAEVGKVSATKLYDIVSNKKFVEEDVSEEEAKQLGLLIFSALGIFSEKQQDALWNGEAEFQAMAPREEPATELRGRSRSPESGGEASGAAVEEAPPPAAATAAQAAPAFRGAKQAAAHAVAHALANFSNAAVAARAVADAPAPAPTPAPAAAPAVAGPASKREGLAILATASATGRSRSRRVSRSRSRSGAGRSAVPNRRRATSSSSSPSRDQSRRSRSRRRSRHRSRSPAARKPAVQHRLSAAQQPAAAPCATTGAAAAAIAVAAAVASSPWALPGLPQGAAATAPRGPGPGLPNGMDVQHLQAAQLAAARKLQAVPIVGTAVRPGDWFCPVCSAHNYASKFQCFRCVKGTNPLLSGSQASLASAAAGAGGGRAAFGRGFGASAGGRGWR